MSDFPPPPPPGDVPPPPPPGGYAQSVAGPVRSPAGFGSRFGAVFVDTIVVGVPVAIAVFVTLAVVPKELVFCTIDGQSGICEQPTGAGFGILAVVGIAAFVGVLFYYGKLEGQQGQTIGKRALNIKTVTLGTDEPIGFGRAIGRQLAHYISGMLCYLGYFWMLWDKNSQTWHDKMTNAQVVKV